MNAGLNYFNSQEAATILGVNVSTIKRWTDEGRLECIQSAGGHRKFLFEHLAAFLDKNKKNTTKINIFPAESESDLQITYHILRGNYSYLIEYIYQQALKSNLGKVFQVLNGLYLGQYPLHQIYDRLLSPVFKEIGINWSKGKLSIAEEHFASQTIKDAINRLQGIIRLPQKNIGKAMCVLPENELHDIPLKMIQHILEIRGFKVYYSGQITPLLGLEEIIEKYKIDRLYISSSSVPDPDNIKGKLNQIYDFCLSKKVPVFVGGVGYDTLPFDHEAIVRRLYTFEDVYNY